MAIRLFALLGAIAVGLAGQDGTPPPEQPEQPPPWKLTGVLDTFYSADMNRPASGLADFRNFDWSQGWELDAAEISVERDGPQFGFRMDGGYGEMFRIMNLADPWGGPNRYLSQAYVSYKPLKNGLRFDFGKFYTSAGAEVPETYNNFNYSRSLLFTLGEPYYHFGLRATIPVTKSFSASVQLVNGWNDVRDNNSGKTVALAASLARAKWGWSQVYITGPEKPGAAAGFRRLSDSVVTLSPIAKISSYLEGLWAMDRRVAGGKDTWSGVAEAVKYSFAKKWRLSERLERFNDPTGFNTGTPQHIKEGTVTLAYRPAPFLEARSEFRRDWSDRAVFDQGARPLATNVQTTVLLGLIFVLRAER